MESEWQAQAIRWGRQAVDEVAASGFAQIDLDTLTGFELDPLLAISAMRLALKAAQEREPNLRGYVVLELEPSARPLRECPEWPAALSSFGDLRATLTVPGIYILADGQPIAAPEDEDYSVAIAVPPTAGPNLSGFYREWRPVEGQEDEDEYLRAVYLTVD